MNKEESQKDEKIEQLFTQLDSMVNKKLTEGKKQNCLGLLANIERRVEKNSNNDNYKKRIQKYQKILNSSFYVAPDNKKTELFMLDGIKYTTERTQVIFFDLEFYVPENDQDKYIFSANPFRENHLLLGGTFLNWKPLQKNKNQKIDVFWLWKYNNDEKQLLDAIVSQIERAWELILAEKGQAELCLCGIGISRVDIGYLYSKALIYKIRPEDKLFMMFHNIRIIELENVVIPYFSHEKGMLIGKNTSQILKRFDIQSKHTSGSNVWELYEKKSYEKIEQRNLKEVNDCFAIYQKLVGERPILKRKAKK